MRRLGVGVIGLRMGRAHLEAYLSFPPAEVVGICDTHKERLEEVQKKYGIPFASQDYLELLEREDIHLVSIVTPDYLHFPMAKEAITRGKHVLCEKPMVVSIEEAKQLVKMVKESGVKFMVGQVSRYAPGFVMTKHLIERGEIGELFFVESEYAHDYARLQGAEGWRKDPVRRREPFLGGGCHAVDLVRWIAGDPVEAFAYANRKVLKDWPVDDCTIAIYRFPKDILGKVFVSIGCKRPYTMRSVFCGDKGTIISDNTSPEILLYREDCQKGRSSLQFSRIPVGLESHSVRSEVEEIVEAILKDEPVKTDVVEGAKTVIACLKAVESTHLKSPLKIEYDL